MSATTYFGSLPAAVPALPSDSSSGYCYPINNGLNKECDVTIHVNLGFSEFLSGSVTNAAQSALGQGVRGLGEFLELVGLVGLGLQLMSQMGLLSALRSRVLPSSRGPLAKR